MIIRLLLFAGVVILVYFQVKSVRKEDWEMFTIEDPLLLTLGLVLVFPNIWLVYRMWSVILKLLGLENERNKRIQSFFAGLITGMLTPNMIGNFIGRIYYYEKDHRMAITGLTLLSNFSQFVVSLSFGLVALYFVDVESLPFSSGFLLPGTFIAFVFAVTIYFFGELLIRTDSARWGLNELRMVVSQDRFFRLNLLGLGAMRFLVFSTQFFLVLKAFDPAVSFAIIPLIWLVYLLTMLAPSLFLGKLGIKESIALFILTAVGVNDFAVLFTSLTIWFVNSLSPAILALFICRKKEIV